MVVDGLLGDGADSKHKQPLPVERYAELYIESEEAVDDPRIFLFESQGISAEGGKGTMRYDAMRVIAEDIS